MNVRKIAILTSGGDAPGMNACVRSVVRFALGRGWEVAGFNRGYQGILDDDCVELTRRSVSNVIGLGGTFLQTDRCPEWNEKEARLRAGEILRSHGIDALVVIGGDGSFRGMKDLTDDTGIPAVGIPGTIDNDLPYTDFTIGFDTAVNNVLWAINSIRDTMHSHNKVTFIEVMGRHCGNIALHSGVTGGAEYILVPEIPFDMKKIANEVKASAKKGKKSNLFVIAEGVGKMEDLAEEFASLTGITPRTTRLGFIQRGGSPTYVDRMLATRFGIEAVRAIERGDTKAVIGIREGKIFTEPIDTALARKRDFDTDLYRDAISLT